MQLTRSRISVIILVVVALLAMIGGMTRWSDATAQSIDRAKELAHRGQFLDAVIGLQEARRKAKSSDATARINAALADIFAEKADFKGVNDVLATTDKFVKDGKPGYALRILSQAQEAIMPLADMSKLAAAVQRLQATEPVAYAIMQAEKLAHNGKFEEAQKLLSEIRKDKATTPVQADQIRRAQNDVEDQQRAVEQLNNPASAPTSSSGHSSLGSFGDQGTDGGGAVAAVSGSPSGLSGATRLQQQDNRSFHQKVSDKLQHMLGLEETKNHSMACTRD